MATRLKCIISPMNIILCCKAMCDRMSPCKNRWEVKCQSCNYFGKNSTAKKAIALIQRKALQNKFNYQLYATDRCAGSPCFVLSGFKGKKKSQNQHNSVSFFFFFTNVHIGYPIACTSRQAMGHHLRDESLIWVSAFIQWDQLDPWIKD